MKPAKGPQFASALLEMRSLLENETVAFEHPELCTRGLEAWSLYLNPREKLRATEGVAAQNVLSPARIVESLLAGLQAQDEEWL